MSLLKTCLALFIICLVCSTCHKEGLSNKFYKKCCSYPATIDSVGSAKFFIPNAFTPNNDGINDVFMIFTGPGIKKINSFEIFKLSELKIFELKEFRGNNPDYSWDGKLKNQNKNDGVYSYAVELENINDVVKTVVGRVCCRISSTLPCVKNEHLCIYGTQHDGQGGYTSSLPAYDDCH